jgi:TolB-like protein/cytochrome c-type biogenesis protein CcmH/NrfG
MSSDEENEYFSAGLSEELLNLLARIPNLRVAARTSAFSFAGSGADAIAIGEALNVAHILEGSVRKSGDTVRITAQLIKASDGYHVWSESWDRQLEDIFKVQDEISAAVVDSLKISLLGEAPKAHAVNPEAYTLYLRGKSVAQIRSEESLHQGATLMREALDIEPEYADAWAALATIRTNQVGGYFLPLDEGFIQARAANERALRFDPDNASARSGLCWIHMYYERDFPAAGDCVRAALKVSPNDPSTLNTAATFYRNIDRMELAIDAYKKAQQTDPLGSSIIFNLTLAYLTAGQLDNAAAQLEIGRSMYADEPLVEVLDAAIALRRGDPEKALTTSENVSGQMGSWMRAIAFQDLGRSVDVDAELQQLEMSGTRNAPFIIASIHAYRGDADTTFEWLERAMEVGDDNLVEIRGGYLFDKMENDPRWQPFLAKIGISDVDLIALGY